MSDTLSGPHEVYGPFLVHERLGVGGMAAVHRATRRLADGTEVQVGLKRLHPHLVDNRRAVEEFVEEARIAALMEHENICRIYESGRMGASYFIAMEYIEGRDLGSLLKQARATGRPPPLSVVLSLLCQLCDALEYAHNRADEDSGAPLEFVHRDVSPTNLVVQKDGRLKVIDLGLARASTREIRTETGVIKGKFGYMAPEVLAGARADRRADIFAVGVVAWELLTAEPLFTGTTDLETMERIRAGTIQRPSIRRPMCPPQLDAVVLRALARRPRDRWTTAAALRTALRAMAAAMHEPISPQVVEEWLHASEPVPIPITRENSDAITLVRQRTPRTMPRRPARFAAGTEQLPKLEVEEVELDRTSPAPRDRAPAVTPDAERRYRALAMLGGGLLTTVVIAALFLTRARDRDAGVRLALPVTAAGAASAASELRSAAERPRPAPRPAESVKREAPPPREKKREALAPSEETRAVLAPSEEMRAVLAPSDETRATVAASEMRRVSGTFPRSRSSRARYRARLCVDARGKVTSVEVESGPERLHRRITRHLRRWRYRPYRRDGAPKPVCLQVEHRLLPR